MLLPGVLPLFLLAFFASGVFGDPINQNIVVKSVDCNIDVQSQLSKISCKLTLENTGKNSAKNFHYAVDAKEKQNLSYFEARSRDAGRHKLSYSKVDIAQYADILFYEVELRDPLLTGRTTMVEIDAVFSHQLGPHPKQITQKERQLVLYTGNVYFFSPYKVMKQSMTIVSPSRNVESYTKIIPVTQSDSTITYGPYESIAPFSYQKLSVHFENNNKFLSITRLERVIEVSHWGNIAVEESIELLHTGALLKGSFSRYEYARESRSGQPSIHSFDTVLPAAASDVYYRDEIGNISTSHMRIKKDSVEVNLRPRFPLFGGWKTKYTLGYNVPSYEYLFNSGNDYALRMRLLDHVYNDMVVDELLVKIILPEGCRDIQLQLPYPAQRLPDSLHHTYLDTTGRIVISIAKDNLVENHIQNFILKYTFPRYLMFQEPLLVALALYLLFLMVIVYVRLDFSISKDEASESKLRIAGQCEKILAAQDRRVTSYNNLDDQLNYLKANKDTAAFLSAAKSINQEYKMATSQIQELAQKVKGEPGDIFDRVQELQKVDKTLKELYNQQQSLYVDKLVPGKIGRQPFIDTEMTISKKKEECVEKINSIVKSLH